MKKGIHPENFMFTNNNNEQLYFMEIINSKKIISVTFTYLSKGKFVKSKGFAGILGFKKEVYKQKVMTITSENGMSLKINGLTTSIFFHSKKEYDKIPEESYNINTLWKQDLIKLLPVGRYQIDFLVKNLLRIHWINREMP